MMQKSKIHLKALIKNIISFIIPLIIAYMIIHFVCQPAIVSGRSMASTFQNNDILLVNKLEYLLDEPDRFDVVVFRYGKNSYYIKRIIGLPGETVEIRDDGEIRINGEILYEEYGSEHIVDAGIAANPITLDGNEYFVLGDNRNNSSDSRNPSVGLINKDEFIGKAFIRIYPKIFIL